HRRGGGDPGRIGQLFAGRAAWTPDWPAGAHTRAVPCMRHRSTRAEAADHFRELAARHVPGESDAHVHAVLVDGADAVVLGEVAHTAKPTGRRYAAAFALHLTVADGLITRYHVYEDSLAVARAFGPA